MHRCRGTPAESGHEPAAVAPKHPFHDWSELSVSTSLAPDWLLPPDDANALVAGVWPESAGRDAAGVLQVAGVPATDLRDRFKGRAVSRGVSANPHV